MRIPVKPLVIAASAWTLLLPGVAGAFVTTFFDPTQVATPMPAFAGPTSEALASNGYLFTYTQDKFWASAPGSPPTGRFSVVSWPTGIHAQAVTAGPTPGPAQVTIQRLDGQSFDLASLTFELLGNTWATGANLEVTPAWGGIDGTPVFLNATGIGGFSTFTYGAAQTPAGSFCSLAASGCDMYTLSLFVDFALLGLTLDAAVAPPPPAELPEPPSLPLLASALALAGLTARRRGASQDRER